MPACLSGLAGRCLASPCLFVVCLVVCVFVFDPLMEEPGDSGMYASIDDRPDPTPPPPSRHTTATSTGTRPRPTPSSSCTRPSSLSSPRCVNKNTKTIDMNNNNKQFNLGGKPHQNRPIIVWTVMDAPPPPSPPPHHHHHIITTTMTMTRRAVSSSRPSASPSS